MNFIEEMQCKSCAFSKIVQDPENEPHSSAYPMCFEIESELIAGGPVAALDDMGNDGVVCTKYKDALLAEQEHSDQSRLF